MCSRRDLMSLYRYAYVHSRLDCKICQGLVEILCVGLTVFWRRWGVDNLRVLCYAGKGCYKIGHL